MNTRLAKEFRQVLPAGLFGGGLLLASAFTNASAQIPMLTLAYWVACSLLAAAPFAGHFGLGEMSAQLAHPISRDTIWREKFQISVRAMGGLALLFLVLSCLSLSHGADSTWAPLALGSLIAAPIACLPIGIWIVLKIGDERAAVILNLLAALVLAALANGIALVGAQFISTRFLPALTGLALVVLAGALAPFLLRAARNSLSRWQDHQPLREEYAVSLREGGKARRTGTWMNWRTLLSKELHLQQTTFLFIAGLLVCGWAVRLEREPELAIVAMMTLVTLFGPMMLGLAAVCEEHRLGIHGQQNTQPAGIDRQWFVKFFVGFLCATTLGWLLIVAARELMPNTRGSAVNLMPLGTIHEFAGFPFSDGPFWRYAIGSAYGVILGMVSGTWFRFYLRSVPALLVFYIVTGWSVLTGAKLIAALTWMNERLYPHFVLFFVTCTLGIVLFLLGKSHYGLSALTPRGVRRHLTILFTVFLLSWPAAHAVYLRAWEHITLQRTEGPPLVKAEQVAGFLPQLMTGSAIDHKGRLWTTQFRWEVNDRLSFQIEDARPVWKQAAGNGQQFFALQTNGTLWVRGSAEWEHRLERWEKYFVLPTYPHALTRFGEDSDWACITGRGLAYHALKQDGTLWSWGANYHRELGLTNRHELWAEPRQVGTDRDWIQIVASSKESINYALKRNGTLWRWGTWFNPNASSNADRYHYAAEPEPVENPLNGRIVRLRTTPTDLMVMLDDSSVEILNFHNGRGLPYDAAATEPVRSKQYRLIGREAQPTYLVDRNVFHWDSIYYSNSALTVDGTAIHQQHPNNNEYFRGPIGSPGDWVSYVGAHYRHLMLKSDGTLWHAGSPLTPYQDWRRHENSKRLIPPRWRPKQIGRLFPEPEADWPR